MARKKAPRKKKGKKASYWWIVPLLLLMASLVATLYFVFLRPGTFDRKAKPHPEARGAKPPVAYEEPHPPPTIVALPYKKREDTGLVQAAIIIDDMGYKEQIGRDLIRLDLNLSFAFLPSGPHIATLTEMAHNRGHDILLHLPMEPKDSRWQPGPGALFSSMTEREIASNLEKNIKAIPFAIGVNNHMGSRFTADPRSMKICLLLLKKKHLFFLDSVTTADSVAYRTAEDVGLPSARRDVFLDHDTNPAAIAKQFDLFIGIAKKNGSAIGIGHPHPETLAVLREYADTLRKEVKLVGVSRLVR